MLTQLAKNGIVAVRWAICIGLLIFTMPHPVYAALPAPIVLPVRTAQILDSATLYPSTGALLEGSVGAENVGGWTDTKVLIHWTAPLPQPGIYRVDLTYSQPTGNEGSTVAVSIGDASLSATPPATGDWQHYQTIPLGDVEIDPAGDVDVNLTATTKPHPYIMNVRSITLTATGEKTLKTAPAQTPLTPLSLAGRRVLWLGDSITQDGTYITDALYYLNKRYPGQRFDWISIGLASETVSGLSEKAHPFPRPDVHERLQRALEKVKPSIVVACYGMNDGIYHPQSPERMAAFQKGIQSVMAAVHGAGARLILLTPPPFDPQPVQGTRKADAADFSYINPYDGYDGVLSDYAGWEMGLNGSGSHVIDLHTPLSEYLKHARQVDPTYHDTADGIHPDPAGHLLMAHIILNALGCPLTKTASPAELESELPAITADPLYKLVQQQRQTRSDGWLPYVGYTRDRTFHTDSIATVEQTVAELQTQIDTRRQPIRVACIGDSITFGAGTSDPATRSYPVQLGHWLGDHYQVMNFGVSGTTLLKKGDFSYWGTPTFTAAKAFQPNIVIIALGTNDTKPQNWKFKEEFADDYKAFVQQFANLPSKPRIFLCHPVPVIKEGNFGINEPGLEQELPMITAVATQEKVGEIDLYAALSGHADLFPDNVHPNDAGAKLIAAAVYHALTGKDPVPDIP